MTIHDTRTRRQLIGSVAGRLSLGAVAVAAVLRSGDAAGLSIGGVESAGAAHAPAKRLQFESSGSLTFPVDTTGGDLVIPNGYGGDSNANGSGGHRGVDIGNGCSTGKGRALVACVDGFLDSEKYLSTAGRLRVLRGVDGNFYRYHHLEAYESSIQLGDPVRAGQVIGYMGSTGNTQWSHLHFEVWIGGISSRQGGAPTDPLPLLPLPLPGVSVGGPTCG